MGFDTSITARRHASVDVGSVLSSPVEEEKPTPLSVNDQKASSRHTRSRSLTIGQKLGFRMKKSPSKQRGDDDSDLSELKSKHVFQAIQELEILDPGIVGPEAGITNEGNTCFLGALLQCVLATPGLARALAAKDVVARPEEQGGEVTILEAMKQIIEGLYTKSTQTQTSVKITSLIEALKRFPLAAEYLNNQQQDVQEVLLMILDILDSELGEKNKEDGNDTIINQWDAKKSSSVIAETFLGQMKSSVLCGKCQKCFTMEEPFLELSLSIAPNQSSKGLLSWLGFNSLSLGDSLFEYTSGDVLEGDEQFFCAHCECKTKATKQLAIHTLPPALILHLKRFKYTSKSTMEKIDKLVTFPLKGLDMRHHLSGESHHKPEDCIYDLYAVAEHRGNLTTGHYTALVRKTIDHDEDAKMRWVQCNDEILKLVSDQAVISPSAYLLFYMRRTFVNQRAAAAAYADLVKMEQKGH